MIISLREKPRCKIRIEHVSVHLPTLSGSAVAGPICGNRAFLAGPIDSYITVDLKRLL